VRRAWLLVSGAAVAALGTVALLTLLGVALVGGHGGHGGAGAPVGQAVGAPVGHGVGAAACCGFAALGTALLAVGLLVLARAGAVAPTRPWRAETLCVRTALGTLAAVVVVLAAGGVGVLLTRSGLPMVGGAVSAVLLVALAGLAGRQRALLRAAQQAALHAALRASARLSLRSSLPPSVPPVLPVDVPAPRSGGGRESEPDHAAEAR
jgi:hypothetical protein